MNLQYVVVESPLPDFHSHIQASVLDHKGGRRVSPCGSAPDIKLKSVQEITPRQMNLPTAVEDEAEQSVGIDSSLLAGQ